MSELLHFVSTRARLVLKTPHCLHGGKLNTIANRILDKHVSAAVIVLAIATKTYSSTEAADGLVGGAVSVATSRILGQWRIVHQTHKLHGHDV